MLLRHGREEAVPFRINHGHKYLKESLFKLPGGFNVRARPNNPLYFRISATLPGISSEDLAVLRELNKANKTRNNSKYLNDSG